MPRLAASGLAALLLASCEPDPPRVAQFFVFGTLVEVHVRQAEADAADAAFAELNERFREIHRDWHAWEPGALVDVNRAFAQGRAVQAPADLVDVVQRSAVLERASGGLFNPAIGGLVRLWGFHTSEYPVTTPPPDEHGIRAWLTRSPSTADIRFDGNVLSSVNPAVQLDLGGIAKGRAVDIALELLAGRGMDEVLVNAGGDLRARGSPEQPWRVGIRGPGGAIIGRVVITADEAVFTSGVDQRYREDGAGRLAHVISPLTGRPVSGLQSVTVLATEGTLADAAATALLVAGPEHWRETAQAMGVERALVIEDDGSMHATEAMEHRVEWIRPGS